MTPKELPPLKTPIDRLMPAEERDSVPPSAQEQGEKGIGDWLGWLEELHTAPFLDPKA
jgi:hypothetical protein